MCKHPVPRYTCPAGADGTYFSEVILTGLALGLLELCGIRGGKGGMCVFLCLGSTYVRACMYTPAAMSAAWSSKALILWLEHCVGVNWRHGNLNNHLWHRGGL